MKSTAVFLFFGVLVSVGVVSAVAGGDETESKAQSVLDRVEDMKDESVDTVSSDNGYSEYRLTQENHKFSLLIGVWVFAALVIPVILHFISKAGFSSAENIISASGLVLVIQGTVFVSLAVVDTNQLTAAVGILGAIAGYLFKTFQKNGQGGGDGNGDNK